MSLTPDLLTEVCLRAWATDDSRVLPLLRAENQPGRTRRARAVNERAKAAGWPVLDLNDRRMAATAAVRRLETMDYTPLGRRDRHRRRVAAAAAGRDRRVEASVDDDYDTDTGRVSMFDE